MSVRLYLENVDDRPNIHYRIIIGVAPKQRADGTVTDWNNLEMLDQGSPGNLIRHSANDLGYKFLYDRVISKEIGSSWVAVGTAVNKRCHLFRKIWIKKKKANKIVYNTSATGVVANIVNKPMFMAVIPYDSQNTLATDLIARLSFQTKLYWKDV